MDAIFETMPVAGTENTEKKAKVDAMKDALKATIAADPTFQNRLNAWSGSLEVVHTLGFGDTGSIIVDASKTDGRGLAQTSAIVGYEVKNVGAEAIPYRTAVCTRGADGIFTAEEVDAVLNPGQTAVLTRQYMTKLCAKPEISFTLKNGKIVKGSGAKAGASVKAILESHYFSFNKDLQLKVNSDEVKKNVAVKGADGRWVVKPEYEATFGELNNPKASAKGARKAAKAPKYDASVIAANYVFSVLMNGEQ